MFRSRLLDGGAKIVRITPLVWYLLWTTPNIEREMRCTQVQWAVRLALQTVAFAVVILTRRQLTEVLLMCFVSDYEETELQP